MLKTSEILKAVMKKSWKGMIIFKSKICFKKAFSSWNTTLKEFTLDKKHFHIHQNLLSKNNKELKVRTYSGLSNVSSSFDFSETF